MNCENCINMNICKWVEVFNDKNADLIETTNGMLGVNCSEYDDGKETGEANKLQCKSCKFNKICKYQFKLEDSTLRFKTKGCLNIECNNYVINENYEIVHEYIDEYMEQNKLDTLVQASVYPDGKMKLSKEEESKK